MEKIYAETNCMRLPIVRVISKCDEMDPSRFKNPNEYPSDDIFED